ncbi:MAG: hypothetical protein AABY76_05535, partial [Planctomycetota bacterium]
GRLFSHEKTIVMDAGIATEDTIALIKKSGYNYVVVSRKKSYQDAFWSKVDEEKIPLSDGKTTLSMKLVRTEEEAFLLCHSEAKEAKEKAILLLKEQRFKRELSSIPVTVLAYHILAGIVKKLRTAGIHHDWNTIRNILATHVRVTTTLRASITSTATDKESLRLSQQRPFQKRYTLPLRRAKLVSRNKPM